MMWAALTALMPLVALLATRSDQPSPDARAPSGSDTATVSFDVGGVRVIHRHVQANDLVAVNLYLLGGSAQLTVQNAGIEAMLLRVSEFGTAAYPGRATRLAFARTGSRTTIEAEPDWTMFGFRGLHTDFDSTWAVFAERVMRPAIDSLDVELVRSRMLIAARSRTNHPDSYVRRLADSIAFAGHPYQADPDGTETSLQSITRDALREYHRTHFVTSRMLLVVVGNVSRAHIEAAIERTFAQLPRGTYTWSLPRPWTAAGNTLAVFDQQLPTNYILGYFAGPPSNSKDYRAFRIATMILGGMAHSEIRKAGLSYVGYAPLLERGAAGGAIYVSTTRPDTAIKIFNNTMKLMRENVVPRYVLRNFYDSFITEFYSISESNEHMADFLARHQLLHGDWRAASRYLQDLRAVSGTDIKNIARNYMKNIQYVFLGNSSRAPAREMGIRP